MVLDCDVDDESFQFETSCRLVRRDGASFLEKILMEDRLSGTSRIGKLIALVARLPKALIEVCLLRHWLIGVAYWDESDSD